MELDANVNADVESRWRGGGVVGNIIYAIFYRCDDINPPNPLTFFSFLEKSTHYEKVCSIGG